jgi:hypothetical protein
MCAGLIGTRQNGRPPALVLTITSSSKAKECEMTNQHPRQRAGKPADYSKVELWVKDMDELEREMDKQWQSDLKSILFVVSCILAFFLIVWGTLP